MEYYKDCFNSCFRTRILAQYIILILILFILLYFSNYVLPTLSPRGWLAPLKKCSIILKN